MPKEKALDLIAVIVIAIMGLFIAYVTFGILDSQAAAEIKKYSVSGAIAGALISITVLASVYKQFRTSSAEFRRLQALNFELQRKVIKGAPVPKDFIPEVAERHLIVLARPESWEHGDGKIFDYQLPIAETAKDDIFPARFWVSFIPITDTSLDDDKYYSRYLTEFIDKKLSWMIPSHTSEYIYLGGQPDPIRALKVMSQEFVTVSKEDDPVSGKTEYQWRNISQDEYEELVQASSDRDAQSTTGTDATSQDSKGSGGNSAAGSKAQPDDSGEPEERPVKLWRTHVVCFCKSTRRVYFFNFLDDDADFFKSSAVFNQILDSVRFL